MDFPPDQRPESGDDVTAETPTTHDNTEDLPKALHGLMTSDIFGGGDDHFALPPALQP
jgi:hypothetical protein